MCGVVATHSAILVPLSNTFNSVLHNCGRGIFLFFITSSFSIFYSLHNRNDSDINYKRFFVRRLCRIIPLYYVILIVSLFQHLLSSKFPEYITISSGIAHILFLSTINPCWAGNGIYGIEWVVSVMVQFYFLVPLLNKYIKNRTDALIALICSIITAKIFVVLLESFPLFQEQSTWTWSWFLRSNIIFLLPVYIMGLLFYFLVFPMQPTTQEQKEKDKMLFNLTLIALIFYLIWPTFWDEKDYFISIVFVALGYLLSKYPSKLIVNPFFCYLGKISYSIYLTHIFMIYLVSKLMKVIVLPYPKEVQYIIAFILVMLLSTLLSTVTYNMIEKRGVSFAEKLIRKFNF